jgi:hypothetical protein
MQFAVKYTFKLGETKWRREEESGRNAEKEDL